MKTEKTQTTPAANPVPPKTSYSERAPNSAALLALFQNKASQSKPKP
jgi:hypothetical protein